MRILVDLQNKMVLIVAYWCAPPGGSDNYKIAICKTGQLLPPSSQKVETMLPQDLLQKANVVWRVWQGY